MDLLFLKNKLSSQMTMTSSFIFNMKNKIKGSSLSDDNLRYIKSELLIEIAKLRESIV